ncbi:MAG: hypothetical protein D6801_03645 [Alphaproteobacteria bacterium]|nr:MAG: hypothetical protein D6801_03645 [Alphaproteobacteria bacterium]
MPGRLVPGPRGGGEGMDGQIGPLGRAPGRELRLGIEPVTSVTAARNLNRIGRAVIVHAEPGWFDPVREGTDAFWPKLVRELAGQGIETRLVAARSKPAEVLRDPAAGHVHVVMGNAPSYARNTLHVEAGYIPGFWYLDEIGVFWHSSLRLRQFCPEEINRAAAEYFFNGVSGWMLRHNLSKAPQAERVPGGLEPARAVIFCQDIEAAPERAHYLTNVEMIRTVAEHDPKARVLVKLRPQQGKASRREIVAAAQDYRNVQLSEASVHDLVAASDIVVTQNSAAGFEALMQKKPVVTCAKADYRHATLTARTRGDLCDALDYGADAMAGFAYEKYFYWFLGKALLEEAKDSFARRAIARIREKAFL